MDCSVVLSVSDFNLCDRVSFNQASRISELSKKTHDEKFAKLLARRDRLAYKSRSRSAKPEPVNTVINLSRVAIDDATHNILQKGLNYALTPIQIPYEKVISSVEEVIIRNKIPSTDAEVLRQDVAVILRKSKLPKTNVTTEERQALKCLRENKDILVLKADKGNATVVLNSTDYDTKIRSLLSDTSIYKPVTYNPTARVTKRIRALVADHKDLFSDEDYQWLYKPKTVQPPKLYGLPKVHKDTVPLRPIVSQVSSPTYDLAKHVARILQPLVGNTSSYVKDSRHFVDIIKSVKVEPDEIMVSFDVESLFTNVPIKDSLEVVEQILREKDMPMEYIAVLKNCLDGNYFLYQGQYYLQIDGVAMGSPVAPVIANIWMEHFEKSIDLRASHVKLWKRYVDDVFCIMRGSKPEVEQLLSRLNSIHSNIRFTYEMETNRSLAFLDVLVKVKKDGSLAHTVYRKTTHTNRYLHAASHHHPRHLQSVISSLTNRAYDLCDPEHLRGELNHVQEVLKSNGYSGHLRRRHREKKIRHPEVSRVPAFMPYVKGVTDKVGTALQKYAIKTVYTPLSKVAKNLRTPKDVISLQTPGVYKIDCSCGSSYIGQTKRTIADRVKEHIAAVKNRQTNKSAIAEHLLESGSNHWIELHEPKILSTDRHYYPRIVREAIEIRKHPNFNRDDGFKLATAWNPVISKCIRRRPAAPRQCEDVVSVVCRSTHINDNNADQVRVVEDSLASRRSHRRNTSHPVTTIGATRSKRRE